MNAHLLIIAGLLQKTQPLSEEEKELMRKIPRNVDSSCATMKVTLGESTLIQSEYGI